jgi:putative FmdB family regulatory protein
MIYRFYCKNCKKEIELSLKVSDYDKAQCECGNKELERVWDGLQQQWKCSGSYNFKNNKE